MSNNLIIFDTTLHDGEQLLGASINVGESEILDSLNDCASR